MQVFIQQVSKIPHSNQMAQQLTPDTTTFLASRDGDLESFLTRDGDFDSFLAREGDLDFVLLVVLVTLIGWEISL